MFCFLCFVFGGATIFAQSTNQNFPTPITSNEINGTIKARDVGDPRLTTFFYAFNGNQGDVFINIVTKNFDGDIDIFTAENLRPLTKIVVYSDTSDNETGRVIYLRQPTKMILRIEGRTPNDESATFRIKFAGSFQAMPETAVVEEPKLPEIKMDENPDVRVNSVGTIIEVKPKPTPKMVEKNAEIETLSEKQKVKKENAENIAKTEEPEKKEEDKTVESKEIEKSEPEKVVESEENKEKKVEVIVTDNLPKNEEKEEEKVETNPQKTAKTKTAKTIKPKTAKPKTVEKKEETEKQPNPLENIRLIVIFKDGTKIERPMSEILKVSVDKGILTIIHKDGSIGRYSILDVSKMTIE